MSKEKFLLKAKEIAEFIKEASKNERFLLFSHYDADGLTSVGILSSALYREDYPFQVRIFRQLEEDFLKEVELFRDGVIIFSDFGSGQLSLMKKHIAKDRMIVVLDHHTPEDVELDNVYHLNPHLYGIDGSTEISSAGIAYLVAKYINEENKDLAAYAIVGAIGDNQDKGKQNSLIGLNQEIITKDAIEADVLEISKGFTIFGRETRPVHIAIEYCTDPYIPEISGNRNNILKLLKELGIPIKDSEGNWRTLASLSTEETKKLVSALISHMYHLGASSDEMRAIVGTIYTLKKERKKSPLRDAREFATLLNSCGRMSKPELGVAIILGDREENYRAALNTYNTYKQQISKALSWLYENRNKIEEYSHVQYFHGGREINENIVGTVASIALSSRLVKPDKPLIGFAEGDDGTIKVSARTVSRLIKVGVSLAKALKAAADEINSPYVAGGHDIAAGARIPKGSEEKFVLAVNKAIKRQLEEFKQRAGK